MKNIDFFIGKVVAYDFGGHKPIIGKVINTRATIQSCKIDDVIIEIPVFGISFNGFSYYTVNNNVKIIG